jgi:hypothetical protein
MSRRTGGPAVDDVQADGTPARTTAGVAAPGPGGLRYHETAVGRLPVGPAADAALAAAAVRPADPPDAHPPAAPERPPDPGRAAGAPSRGAVLRRLAPGAAVALGAALAIVLVWRRATA